MNILFEFQYFCNISSILIPILTCKLLFQREKCALRDSPKFNTIQRSNKKVNFLTIPNQGFGQIFCKMVFFKCCNFWIYHSNMYLILPFLALKFVILHFFQIFYFLVSVLTCKPDQVRYHQSSTTRSQFKTHLHSPLPNSCPHFLYLTTIQKLV